jgi:hypothetical protein
MIINYDRNHSFIVLATVITMVNYNRKMFIAQATDLTQERSSHYRDRSITTNNDSMGEIKYL